MPDWLIVCLPVLLGFILTALAAIFWRLGEHGERLARLEVGLSLLASGHRVVNYGSNPSAGVGSAP